MPAPKGHPLWGNPLNPKKYTPEELWNKAVEYFEHCKSNPYIKKDFVSGGQMAGTIVDLETENPFCIEDFCTFADISFQTFSNYSKAEGYETFFEVCTRIRQIIDAQHFKGGMVGIYNANIVTRKLGLIEKSEQNIKGETALKVEVSNPETKAIIEDLIAENES